MTVLWIGRLSDFTERRARTVEVDGVEVAVFRLSDGQFRAVENRCPHKNGKLSEGIVCGRHVFCPLHDAKVNLDSGRLEEPDVGQVRVYTVEVDEEGRVMLMVNQSGSIAS